jgi:hypothetical protein
MDQKIIGSDLTYYKNIFLNHMIYTKYSATTFITMCRQQGPARRFCLRRRV